MNTATKTSAAESIANADAHLNDAGLPTYSAIVEQHAALLAACKWALQFERTDRGREVLGSAIAMATGSAA